MFGHAYNVVLLLEDSFAESLLSRVCAESYMEVIKLGVLPMEPLHSCNEWLCLPWSELGSTTLMKQPSLIGS